MIDMVPVTVNWLVTVKGCAAGMIPNGMAPTQFAARMNVNAVNIHGRYLRPSLPILWIDTFARKPVRYSTAICQRPGTSCRFRPPHMKATITPRTTSIHSAELVNWNGLAAS